MMLFRPKTFPRSRLLAGVCCAAIWLSPLAIAQTTPTDAVHALPLEVQQWHGDFDAMLERRLLRVLLPVSRSLFFIDKGAERGMSAELMRDFERFINAQYKKQLGRRPLTIALLPTPRDELLKRLNEGYGDIAGGNLTVTEDRLRSVDFVHPAGSLKIKEVVVSGSAEQPLEAADDLAGQTVHVRKSSSYYASLQALNARLVTVRRPPVRLILVPEALEDEDLMEMIDAGLIARIVVDDWKARLWAKVLPNIRIDEAAVLREGSQIGWAIRKNSPQLREVVSAFYTQAVKPQSVIHYRMTQYEKKAKSLHNPTNTRSWQRFEQIRHHFEQYATQYGFDPLLLIAQGYQESRLDQNARSPSGAIGIMQLLPATGKAMDVGDIHQEAANIHAGVKYMSKMLDKYFSDAALDDMNRTLFAIAAYNAGPSRIASLRREAPAAGLDPNQWFNHVEVLVAKKVGLEPTTYVRNIYKYYASYKLQLEQLKAQEEARRRYSEKLAPAPR